MHWLVALLLGAALFVAPLALALAYLGYSQRRRALLAAPGVPDPWPGRVTAFRGHLSHLAEAYSGDVVRALADLGDSKPCVLVHLLAVPSVAVLDPVLGGGLLNSSNLIVGGCLRRVRLHAARATASDESLMRGRPGIAFAAVMHAEAAHLAEDWLAHRTRGDLLWNVTRVVTRGVARALGCVGDSALLSMACEQLHDSAISSLSLLLPARVAAAMFRMRREASGQLARVRDSIDQVTLWRLAHGAQPLAIAVYWCLARLITFPDAGYIEEVMRELASVSTRDATAGTCCRDPRRSFVRRFVQEVLRLHAPVPVVMREVPANSSIVLSPTASASGGTSLLLPLHAYHTNDRFWKDARQFYPDRFLNNETPGPHARVYAPFGAACPFERESHAMIVAFLHAVLSRAKPVFEWSSRLPRESRGTWLTLPTEDLPVTWVPVTRTPSPTKTL
jgi:hypothetical protein